MQAIRDRFSFFFTSTRGLILLAIASISVVTALFGFLSGPMEEFGVRDFMIRTFGISLDPAEREGRIIMLYHAIAMAVVAIQVYMITSLVKMRRDQQMAINSTMTFGFLLSMIFGLWFAYFGHNYVFHGLFITGQAIIFFAGLRLAWVLWPWRKELRITDPDKARTRGGIDLERLAFFTMAVAMLGSALYGAIPGSMYGNGFRTFLAEDVVRDPIKTPFQLAIIGHLHVMLALIAVAMTLVLGRWFNFRGRAHKWAMPLMIVGTIIMTMGVWVIVPYQAIAHIIINVGAMPILVASLLLVWFGWRQTGRERARSQGIMQPTFRQRAVALLGDPLRFGALWQMVYMNFVVTALGIFMAVRLDAVIRQWPWREERVTLTGHWHVLAGIIATIILFYYADLAGLKGRPRQLFGWLLIIASDLAFGAIAVFETKRLFVSESAQQALVDRAILLTDIGLATVLLVLAVFMIWRLVDLFKRNGRWRQELAAKPAGAEQEVLQ